MRSRIYIDTSVIGGYFDNEFSEYSIILYNKFISGEWICVLSEITKAELDDAPKNVKKLLEDIPKENIEYVELTQEAVNLANKYIAGKVISGNMLADA